MIFKRISLVAAFGLLAVALYLFANDKNIEGGLTLTGFWKITGQNTSSLLG